MFMLCLLGKKLSPLPEKKKKKLKRYFLLPTGVNNICVLESLWGVKHWASPHICCCSIFIYCILYCSLDLTYEHWCTAHKEIPLSVIFTVLSGARSVISLKHALVYSHVSIWREEWKSVQLGGAELFWTGFSKPLPFLGGGRVVYPSPPLLCLQF